MGTLIKARQTSKLKEGATMQMVHLVNTTHMKQEEEIKYYEEYKTYAKGVIKELLKLREKEKW